MDEAKLEQLLREGIGHLYDDEPGLEEAEPVEVPAELRERILAKAAQAAGMLAAAEARAAGVEIVGWEPTPGADAEHYYMGEEEFREMTGTS